MRTRGDIGSFGERCKRCRIGKARQIAAHVGKTLKPRFRACKTPLRPLELDGEARALIQRRLVAARRARHCVARDKLAELGAQQRQNLTRRAASGSIARFRLQSGHERRALARLRGLEHVALIEPNERKAVVLLVTEQLLQLALGIGAARDAARAHILQLGGSRREELLAKAPRRPVDLEIDLDQRRAAGVGPQRLDGLGLGRCAS